MTFRVVFGGEGVSTPSFATAPEFLGTAGGNTRMHYIEGEPPNAIKEPRSTLSRSGVGISMFEPVILTSKARRSHQNVNDNSVRLKWA